MTQNNIGQSEPYLVGYCKLLEESLHVLGLHADSLEAIMSRIVAPSPSDCGMTLPVDKDGSLSDEMASLASRIVVINNRLGNTLSQLNEYI